MSDYVTSVTIVCHFSVLVHIPFMLQYEQSGIFTLSSAYSSRALYLFSERLKIHCFEQLLTANNALRIFFI